MNVDEVLNQIEAWRSGHLWGAKTIAWFAGVSMDTVVRWADHPNCPITKRGGRYYVRKDTFMAWMSNKKCA